MNIFAVVSHLMAGCSEYWGKPWIQTWLTRADQGHTRVLHMVFFNISVEPDQIKNILKLQSSLTIQSKSVGLWVDTKMFVQIPPPPHHTNSTWAIWASEQHSLMTTENSVNNKEQGHNNNKNTTTTTQQQQPQHQQQNYQLLRVSD